ncbi:hypothetical protein CR194_14830 [Salipaludibacillus keqinensis]|uniref:Sporulation protein n=1 Tax=Salipaludibacillus keqinensis TaxID=2045207 RepID=A0A323TCV1_9BACI|nr:YhcN/YlaJ family sporulation lipoprotein [Salipaludibacillus keqinensis]PYZ92911.1 hypothetical protein CR194_14830 [Salipaludibacillus keqinensis]
MILKTKMAFLLVVISLVSVACGNTGNTDDQTFDFMRGYGRDDQSQAINKEEVRSSDPYTQYGFQRNTKNSVRQEGSIPGYSVYDRSLLAESISEMAAMIKDVNDVGVLVTDQHVLIAYASNAQGSPEREKVADQVKKTAMSVVPSYFDIYVADSPEFMDEIERFKGSSSKNNTHAKALEQTIEQMKEFPQGQSTDSENKKMRNEMSSHMND